METNFSSRLNQPKLNTTESRNEIKEYSKQWCINLHQYNLIQPKLFEIKKDLSIKKPTLLNSVLKMGNDFYHAEKTNLGYNMVTSFNGLT